MLSTTVGIFSPSSSGGGVYTFQLFFSPSSAARNLRLGDTVRDSTGNEYSITTWAAYDPDIDFVSGVVVTTSFITSDVLPQVDTGFDSLAFTPGQVDRRPFLRSPGVLFNINNFNGQTYEFSLNASWSQGAEAAKAEVGDRIVDAAGKEYEISFLDAVDRFNVLFRMTEVEAVGITPSSGNATLYRPTTNHKLFQGNEITDPARTNIFNRDSTIIDELLGSGSGGATNTKNMVNNSGAEIPANKPVSVKTDGSIVLSDSDGADTIRYVGITAAAIPNGQAGPVQMPWPNGAGVLTGLGFTSGSEIFMAQSAGTFTDDPASFTDMNDTFVKVGIAHSADGVASGTATDLIMFTEVLGSF